LCSLLRLLLLLLLLLLLTPQLWLGMLLTPVIHTSAAAAAAEVWVCLCGAYPPTGLSLLHGKHSLMQ
jgi:hypothetical protein